MLSRGCTHHDEAVADFFLGVAQRGSLKWLAAFYWISLRCKVADTQMTK